MTERAPTPQELEEAKARDLSNRLRGRYSVGPIMANGEPEFGYCDFTEMPGAQPLPAIYGEAADMIDALLAENEKLKASLLEAVEALEPFAAACDDCDEGAVDDHGHCWESGMAMAVSYGDFRRAAQVHARLSLEGGEGSGWLPIESAPKDGTWIQARIPGHGEDNIILWVADALEDGNGSCGAWAFALEDQEPPHCWSDGWCWAVNEDGVRSAWPTHWKLPPPPEHQGGE